MKDMTRMKHMKRTKRAVWLACLLILALCLSACALGREEKLRVAVIVKATDSDFWHGVKSGVQAAATEYRVDVTFEGPENEEDYETQNRMIEAAVSDRVDVIVLSAIDYEKSVPTVDAAVRAGVRVITIDSDVGSNLVSLFIGTDNFAAGEAAAAAALNGRTDVRIGLVNYMTDTENGRSREDGFRAYVAAHGGQIAGTVTADSNTESATAAALSLLSEHPDIDVLVGFNEWMTLGVGEAIRKSGKAGVVRGVGFDTNVVSVGMMESGEMSALIVQNPFAIGYLGVRYAADTSARDTTKKEVVHTATATVTKDNLFDEDIQKILFRFG